MTQRSVVQDLAAKQRQRAVDLETCKQALEAQVQLQKQLHAEQLREKDLELDSMRRELDQEVAAIKALLAAPVVSPEHAVSIWVGNGLLCTLAQGRHLQACSLQVAPGYLNISHISWWFLVAQLGNL